MAKSPASTVAAYLTTLPRDRRAAIGAVRDAVNAALPDGFVEAMQYGMISWIVPLARYPDTYNKQPLAIASLASQKSYMALYLTSVYADRELETWFRARFAETGKKLDMGKSCVRFKALADLPLDVVGETIAKVPLDAFLARYEAVRAATTKKPNARTLRGKAKAKPARSVPRGSARARPATRKKRRAARAPRTSPTGAG